jgi:uncharacterized membrane protein
MRNVLPVLASTVLLAACAHKSDDAVPQRSASCDYANGTCQQLHGPLSSSFLSEASAGCQQSGGSYAQGPCSSGHLTGHCVLSVAGMGAPAGTSFTMYYYGSDWSNCIPDCPSADCTSGWGGTWSAY